MGSMYVGVRTFSIDDRSSSVSEPIDERDATVHLLLAKQKSRVNPPICTHAKRAKVHCSGNGAYVLTDNAGLLCRYAETVIYRIFFTISKLGHERISYREFRR